MKVEDRQSIWDKAIELYGGVQGVFAMMADNPDVVPDLNTVLTAGDEIRVKSSPVDADVLAYYQEKQLRPATATMYPESGGSFLATEDGAPLLTEQQDKIGV